MYVSLTLKYDILHIKKFYDVLDIYINIYETAKPIIGLVKNHTKPRLKTYTHTQTYILMNKIL